MSMPMILEPPSDGELMVRVREGDRDAFSDLVDRHKDAVVSYLTRLSGDRDRAEDLAQDTFLRLFRAARDYTEQGYLRAYLFRIATNLVRSVERRGRRGWLSVALFPPEGGPGAGGPRPPAPPGRLPGRAREPCAAPPPPPGRPCPPPLR